MGRESEMNKGMMWGIGSFVTATIAAFVFTGQTINKKDEINIMEHTSIRKEIVEAIEKEEAKVEKIRDDVTAIRLKQEGFNVEQKMQRVILERIEQKL